MNKIDVVEELLPGFQRFLSDLATCRLTSALEAQVKVYNQNIEDYISQNFSMPKSLPPDPPTALNGIQKKKADDFAAKQRELARMSQLQTVSKDDSYYNVSMGSSEADSGLDNFYENPTVHSTPPVPTSSRPHIRDIQDDPLVYEEPDQIPVKVQGKASTMPIISRQSGLDREASDSGGTFVSFHSSSSSQQCDSENYEDVPNGDDYPYHYDDDSSTSYDTFDEAEIEKHKNMTIDTMDSNANKTKPKAEEKTDKDKLATFCKRFEGDAEQMGLLYVCKKGMTLSKRSLGAWNKRYCLARDMRLQCYKKCDSKQPALELVLLGNVVTYVGVEAKRANVFSVNNPSCGTELFSAASKEEAHKWVEVLKGYATMGNELVPSTGFVGEESSPTMTNTADDITKKLMRIFKREKKTVGQQLSMDDKGVVSGYINVLGAKFGDNKWRKKFVTIEEGIMSFYSEDGDNFQFEFQLDGTQMAPADPKATRRKMAMRIFRGAETLVYIQFFNHLDMGPLLQVYTKILDPKKGSPSLQQRGMVSNILKAFEKQNSDSGDQDLYDEIDSKTGRWQLRSQTSSESFADGDGDKDGELYDDICLESPKPAKTTMGSIYTNFKIVMQHSRTRSASVQDSPGLVKKGEEQEPAQDAGKKDKKNKKDKKDKKDKKGKGAKEPEPAPTKEVAVEPVKRRNPSVINKFKESDKSHLLVVDKLEVERKEVDERKRAITKMKADLSAQKRRTTDLRMKEQLDVEFKKVQQEWSDCSSRLAFINNEIERLTKGSDGDSRVEQKQDAASAEVVRSSLADPSKKETQRATSPGRQVVQKSVGNVQDKLKMFQGMGNK